MIEKNKQTVRHPFALLPHLAKRRHCCGLCKLSRRLDLHIRLAKQAISMSCQYTHALRRSFASQKACLLLPLVAIDFLGCCQKGYKYRADTCMREAGSQSIIKLLQSQKQSPNIALALKLPAGEHVLVSQY